MTFFGHFCTTVPFYQSVIDLEEFQYISRVAYALANGYTLFQRRCRLFRDLQEEQICLFLGFFFIDREMLIFLPIDKFQEDITSLQFRSETDSG